MLNVLMMLITMQLLYVIILEAVFVQLRLILQHRILAAVLSILEDLTITFDSSMFRACFVKGDVAYGLSAPLPTNY